MNQTANPNAKQLASLFQLKTRAVCFTFLLSIVAIPTSINAKIFQESSTKYQNVQVRLEVRGNIVSTPAVETADENQENLKANVVPISVKAAFDYEELVQESATGLRSVRYYDRASANIDINSQQEASSLADSNRYVLFNRVVRKDVVDRVALASLQGRLTQKQWQLIEVPANSMLIDQLFADQDLSQGKSWQPDDKLLADILLLDAIDESDVQLKVEASERNQKIVSIIGGVIGGSDDAETNLRVAGRLAVNPQTKRVERGELTIRQKKNEGQIGPGFDVTIKVQVDIAPRSAPDRLTKTNIARIRGHRSISSNLIVESPQKTLQFIHDRRWRMIINSTELMVLRLLDDGQVLGQCNVIPMPRIPSGDAYGLEHFKANVKDAIGDVGKIVHTNARKTPGGNVILEIEVAGEQSGVPLTWLYYHIAQSNGERAMCILTTESELVDSIRGTELTIVESLLIRSPEEASEARKLDAAIRSR